MKTSISFQKLIRKNRKLLLTKFKEYTVRSWAYGYRMPNFDNAIKLAQILNMNIKDIPYRRVEVNRP